jgi:hypothetical protein
MIRHSTQQSFIMHYIISISSYQGDDTSRRQDGGEDQPYNERLEECPGTLIFAIIYVTASGAEIVDDGYRSYKEAKETWPNAK